MLTMYSTPWCGYCHRLKSQLDREGIAYTVVDIEQDPEAAVLVEQINNGNQVVPTVVFSDGSAFTNPSLWMVKEKLSSLSAWRPIVTRYRGAGRRTTPPRATG